MKYPKEYLDEIKARLKVSTVVSKSINLKKRGKEYVGLSPFKTEKTPSFTVNDEKEFYHCFSTAEHGNIFDFVMKTQNLKFGEAVKYLANLAGMRQYTFSKQDEEREKDWIDYKSIYSKYVHKYHEQLFKNPLAEVAKKYLKNRGLTIEEVKKFMIGYVTNDTDIYNELSKEFNEKKIINLIDKCSKYNIEKIIFVSTCSNYGIISKNEVANEKFKLNPQSLYAKSKIKIEKYLEKINNKTNSQITILRFATAFGV